MFMNWITYLLILLPIILAFAVLYFIDADLERRINHPGLVAVVEVLIALMILIFGFRLALSILF
jgi:uncharacterized membrane protein